MKTAFFYFLSFFCINYYLISQEVQIPIDNNGKVIFLDSSLNNKINVFTDYSEFIEARLFKQTDTTYILEIYYIVDDQYSKHRKILNQMEMESLRHKVTQKLNENESNKINQDGRTELLWGLTTAGLGIYGPASIMITDSEDGSVAIGSYMLTAAASFLIPYALTSSIPVSKGAARLSVWGAYSGAFHGFLIYNMFDFDKTVSDDAPGFEYTYTETDNQILWGLMTLTSIVESYIGYRIAQDYNFSPGKSDLMISTSTASTGILPGLLYLSGVEDEKTLFGTALLGSFGGYALGNYISNTQNYTRGDATVFTNALVLGTFVSASSLIAMHIKDSKAILASAIIGAGAGMYAGDLLVRGKDFTTSQSVYMSLATLGGAFVTGGLSFFILGDNEDNLRIIPLLISLGGVGGFALTYSVFHNEPSVKEKNLSSDLRFNFNPFALLTVSGNVSPYSPDFRYNPMISLSYSY